MRLRSALFGCGLAGVIFVACADDETASKGTCVDCATGSGGGDGGGSATAVDGGGLGDGASSLGVDASASNDASTLADAANADAALVDASVSDAKVANASKDAAKDTGVPVGDGGGTVTYSTDFSTAENPISESSAWTNGGAVGVDFQNVKTANGLAYGTGTSANYDDCIATLSGFPANQFAEATVHVQSGYTANDSHEVELLLRFKITSKNARGYEINDGWNGAYSEIVRWNGAMGDFTMLSTTGPGFGALAEGDVIRAEAIGDQIVAYKNGVEVMRATDATWSDGNPGMGFFIRPNAGSVPENYCFTSFRAGTL